MDVSFSFATISIPTTLLHAAAAFLIYYAVRELDVKKQAAALFALLLWGTTITTI